VQEWFGTSWAAVGFVVASTVATYLTVLVAVRLAGRRTVAQLSAFDLIVTVALGTLLASTIVSPDPSYVQASVGIATLLTLQVVVAALRRRSGFLRRVLEFEPEVVLRDGRLQLPSSLLSSQLSEGELRSRLREVGVFDLADVALVVLEPTGRISVLPTDENESILLLDSTDDRPENSPGNNPEI
jgi:uncharacterized membrane protein YcaP (DUF421 family)